jgi:hypothetical protein
VANDALLSWHGTGTENFEEVARALNEGNALPRNTNGKHCNDRYKLLFANFRTDRARALASGTQGDSLFHSLMGRRSAARGYSIRSQGQRRARPDRARGIC